MLTSLRDNPLQEQVKNKGKGKSSTRFPSKKSKKEGACNDVESSDNEGAKSGGSKKKITKKVNRQLSNPFLEKFFWSAWP